MANFTKIPLSGGAGNGRGIAVGATATPGTTIHTATASTTNDSLDEIWIWAGSTSAAAVNLGITFGGGNNPFDQIQTTIGVEYSGPVLVVPGLLLNGANVVTATCSAAGKINLHGYVNRISNQTS